MSSRYFPLFFPLEAKKVLVFGAGAIALRRIQTLLQFGAAVTVVAPDYKSELLELESQNKIILKKRGYLAGEIAEVDLVLAATDNREVNSAIYRECKNKKIFVNNAGDQSQCDFFFPAIVEEEPFVVGITAGGSDHRLVRRFAADLRKEIGKMIEKARIEP